MNYPHFQFQERPAINGPRLAFALIVLGFVLLLTGVDVLKIAGGAVVLVALALPILAGRIGAWGSADSFGSQAPKSASASAAAEGSATPEPWHGSYTSEIEFDEVQDADVVVRTQDVGPTGTPQSIEDMANEIDLWAANYNEVIEQLRNTPFIHWTPEDAHRFYEQAGQSISMLDVISVQEAIKSTAPGSDAAMQVMRDQARMIQSSINVARILQQRARGEEVETADDAQRTRSAS